MPTGSKTVAELRSLIDKLDGDVYEIGPRPEGVCALERLMALVLQGDHTLASAEKAIRILRARYGNWSEMRVARHYEIADGLRAGRAVDAAGRSILVQEYLRRVFGLQNHLELDWIYDATPERRDVMLTQVTMAPLQAAAVLDLDALEEEDDKPPIGKDLKRLFSRLGLVKNNPKEADVRALLDPLTQGDELYPNYVKLRLLAKLGCDPKNPQGRAAQLLKDLWGQRNASSNKAFAQAAQEMGLPLGPGLQAALKEKTTRKVAPKKTTAKKPAVKKPAVKKSPAKNKAAKK
jgi:hypothetical protein